MMLAGAKLKKVIFSHSTWSSWPQVILTTICLCGSWEIHGKKIYQDLLIAQTLALVPEQSQPPATCESPRRTPLQPCSDLLLLATCQGILPRKNQHSSFTASVKQLGSAIYLSSRVYWTAEMAHTSACWAVLPLWLSPLCSADWHSSGVSVDSIAVWRQEWVPQTDWDLFS